MTKGHQSLSTTGPGWELLDHCGRPITDEFAQRWFVGKTTGKWLMNASLGIAAALDHRHTIETIFLFADDVEGNNKALAGELPGGIHWSSTRASVRSVFGPPEASGERDDLPETSIMHLAYSWDRWQIETKGLVRVEYFPGEESIRSIQLQQPPRPEPTLVELEVYADYYQFYVADVAHSCDTGAIWDEPYSTDRQLALGDGLVAIGTKRYGTVPVEVTWYPAEPELVLEGLDRVNECGLRITTTLGVGNYISCDPLVEVPMAPGNYAMRVLYLFQDTVVNDQTGQDRYVVQLWPVEELPPVRYLKP